VADGVSRLLRDYKKKRANSETCNALSNGERAITSERKETMHKMIKGSMAVAALLLAGQVPAADSVVDKVKKACNKELTTFCKGVKPGEGRILACLYAFEDQVSDQCEYAVYDAAIELEKAVAALKFAANQCASDLEKFCANVKPGEGRALACLSKNDKAVSQPCKDALKQTGLKK
jgi:hypothetical protein